MAYTRLTVNINSETDAALRDLSQREEASITEVVRRAVSIYKYVFDNVDAGKTLQLVDADETITLRLM